MRQNHKIILTSKVIKDTDRLISSITVIKMICCEFYSASYKINATIRKIPVKDFSVK